MRVRAGTSTLPVLVSMVFAVCARERPKEITWPRALRIPALVTVPSPDLPPWFGDPARPPVRIAGKVFGATEPMTVHLLADLPDLHLWAGRTAQTTATGEFDFGPLRAGRYLLFADSPRLLAHFSHLATLRDPGDRTELFAVDRTTLTILRRSHPEAVDDYDWRRAMEFTESPEPNPGSGVLVNGIVRKANGEPASFVGVHPIARRNSDHAPQHDLPLVVTTDAAGRYCFVAVTEKDEPVFWLQIFMGTRLHEARIWNDGTPFVVDLPPPGQEAGPERIVAQRELGDPRGQWLHGRVLRDGRPVADTKISAMVLPSQIVTVADTTRSRSDGTFALFISTPRIDTETLVMVDAENELEQLSSAHLVTVTGGHGRSDLSIDVGPGLTVSGIAVDEHGRPLAAVKVGDNSFGASPTAADGSFHLTLHSQGRHRLGVFDGSGFELAPPAGELPPAIDVARLDGERAGLRIVVQHGVRLKEQESGGSTGWVNLGAKIDHGIVRAVGDELAAAGLQINDEVIARDPVVRKLDYAGGAGFGESITLIVNRNGTLLAIHATAPNLDRL